MDTGIIVAIDPYQPTVTPASLHALGGHDFDLLLQPENYGSFSDGLLDLASSVNDPMQSPGCYVPDGVFYSGGQKHYVDPDMVNPPGSANPNIYDRAATSIKMAEDFICYHCGTHLASKRALIRHEQHHCPRKLSKLFLCPLCQTILSRSDSLKRHLEKACPNRTKR
uniref:C2H2-type domain-containing protein n=1 Tax=Photinus pyralis TaxID=7054 RepID=A0A1Y1MT80_PHOPY